MPDSSDRLKRVLEQIAAAARRANRQPSEIELVAVSKTHSPENIMEVFEAGHGLFGESKVQEARAKIPLLPGKLRWHFIGHLQKNKIRQALPLFEVFHSVDSLELAQDINRVAAEAGIFPKVLLEVNVAGESSKFGFAPERLRREMDSLLALDRLEIQGVMAIPPLAPEAESSRKFFVQLRKLRDQIQSEFRVPLPELSMGMSGDFEVAIEEGATFVRVGSAIFGSRTGKGWKPSADATFD